MSIRLGNAFKLVALTVAALAAGLMPHPGLAALGEPEATAATDAQRLQASSKSTERLNYRIHEFQLPSGTVVREFAAPGGDVFAVAWNGPAIPDLRQTLGTYFDDYLAAAQARHAGHAQLQLRQPNLIVQSGGHMRAFTGRAYLPEALPAGVSADELR